MRSPTRSLNLFLAHTHKHSFVRLIKNNCRFIIIIFFLLEKKTDFGSLDGMASEKKVETHLNFNPILSLHTQICT